MISFLVIFRFAVSAIHGGQQYQYTNAQKLVALPAYHQQQTQAYKTVVAPTTSTSASSYTAAYVQPTAISPVKVRTEWLPQMACHLQTILKIRNRNLQPFLQPSVHSSFHFVSFQYIPQTQQNYYGSASTAYAQKLAAAYAPANFVAPTPQAYLSSYHQQQPSASNNQGLAIHHLPQASNQQAIHYGSQQLYSPASLGKYSYTQIAAPHKFFYASQ